MDEKRWTPSESKGEFSDYDFHIGVTFSRHFDGPFFVDDNSELEPEGEPDV